MRKAYEKRIMDLRKEEAILAQKLDDAIERGRKIDKEEGRKTGKIEVEKKLLADT